MTAFIIIYITSSITNYKTICFIYCNNSSFYLI